MTDSTSTNKHTTQTCMLGLHHKVYFIYLFDIKEYKCRILNKSFHFQSSNLDYLPIFFSINNSSYQLLMLNLATSFNNLILVQGKITPSFKTILCNKRVILGSSSQKCGTLRTSAVLSRARARTELTLLMFCIA